MVIFVIAGVKKSLEYFHAIYLAEHLQKILPTFKLHKLTIPDDDWKDWLHDVLVTNKWYHTKCPLIWKELLRINGGKKYLIGGTKEFFEYCYDYYGLRSSLTNQDLTNLFADYLLIDEFLENTTDKSSNWIVGITGANLNVLPLLIYEIEKLRQIKPYFIRLFNIWGVDAKKKILSSEDINISISGTLKEVLIDCDLLFVMENVERKPNETQEEWLEKRTAPLNLLSDEINQFAKRSMKIIVTHSGPVCYDATILVRNCTSIRLQNIVAITSDRGLSVLNLLKQTHEINLEEISGPPIWGFIDTNFYIDLKSIVTLNDCYRPYLRALTNDDNSTLTSGQIRKEFRLSRYFINENLVDFNDYQVKLMNKLGRAPILRQIRAIADLLDIWFNGKKNDDVISMGILSDGTFGIPSGIIFSQPSIMNKSRQWIPFNQYPVSTDLEENLKKILEETKNIIEIN